MSSVNYLEKLLDGVDVKWKPLGELADIYGGLTGKTKADFDQGTAKYITYKNIFSNIEVNVDIFEKVQVSPSEKQHKVQYGDILLTGSSEIAEEAGMSSAVTTKFNEPVYLNSFSIGVRFKSNISLSPEFAKYLFRTSRMRAEISKTASGVTRFNVSKDRLKKILIPILSPETPEKSLEIQAEIVRILDAMTAHTAELTAELTARKKQYNYYRDKLLSFEDGEVEWRILGELVDINTGSRPPEIFETATAFDYINAGTSRSGYSAACNCVGDAVTTPSRGQGGIGYVGYQVDPFWLGPLCYKLQSVDKAVLINKYLFYFLQSRSELLLGLKKEGGVPAVNKSDLAQLKIPIPSLGDQQRIIAILDKFNTLANSISKGLPREIELRQKQYEYYRDLLLNVPKLESVGA